MVVAALSLGVAAVRSGAVAAQLNVEKLAHDSWAVLQRDVPFSWPPYFALGLILLLQWRFPVRRQRSSSPGFCLDLLWMLFKAPLTIVVLAGYLPLLLWTFTHSLGALRVNLADHVPLLVLVAISFVIGDFLAWIYHYLKHRVPVLWRFHAVHHSNPEMNPFADSRMHVVEFFVNRTITVLPFFLLGGGARDALAGSILIQIWYARFYHSNIRTNLGPLRHVLVTPQYHRVHHSIEPQDADKNLGTFLTIWDRLFGTMVRDYDRYPETGIADRSFPHPTSRRPVALVRTYVAQLAYPFTRGAVTPSVVRERVR